MMAAVWSIWSLFGNRTESGVPAPRPDFSNSEHYNIGGLVSRTNSTVASTSQRRKRSRSPESSIGARKYPFKTTNILPAFGRQTFRAKWTKVSGKKSSVSSVDTVDLDSNDEVIGLDPPMKRAKMDPGECLNGSVFGNTQDKNDIEIVEVVDRKSFLSSIGSSLGRRFSAMRPLRKSALTLEAQREDKIKFSNLLRNHVYPNLNRWSDKPSFITQKKAQLAVADLKLLPTDMKRPENPPPVIDLTDEEKESRVVSVRVQVNRQHSLTPVTQATENPHVSTGKSMERRASSGFLRRQPLSQYVDKDYLADLKNRHSTWKMSLQGQIKNQEEKVKRLGDLNREASKQRMSATIDDLNKKLVEMLKDKECYVEEEEKEIGKVPEITEEMKVVIDKALRGNPGEVLVEAFNQRILRRDIQTLQGLNWLNDEVINFYMNLLMDRGKQESYPSVYAFNTFFYPRLISGGHSALKRWTKKVDIFSYDYVVAPVHLGVHWCMAIMDMKQKLIMYFDSMGGRNEQCLKALKQYLTDEKMDKKREKMEDGWESQQMKDIPQQQNGSDCGMFSCMYAEYITRGASITFGQEHMPDFRKKMIYEIMKKKLLW